MAWTVWKTIIQDVDEDLGDFVSGQLFNRAVGASGVGWNLKYDRTKGDILVNLLGAGAGPGLSVSTHEGRTNTAYQVPAGRKFIGFARLTSSGPSPTTMNIRSSVTVDTADGTVVYSQTDALTNTLITTSQIFTILANQFLTLEKTFSGIASAQMDRITGFETDA